MPTAGKFAYNGRTPRTLNEHMSKLRAAANKAAKAAANKAAAKKAANKAERERIVRMQRMERMWNYIKRLPKNHIGKKIPKRDLAFRIELLRHESNWFNKFKSYVASGVWTPLEFALKNKAAANKAAANKAKALKKKNTPKPKNFKLSESLKKEAKKYRVKLMRQTWNYPAGSNKKNIVYVPKTRTQIQNEIKKMKMKSSRDLMRDLMRR